MATRHNLPPTKPLGPKTTHQWAQLMRSVLARAETVKHPIVNGLREAQAKGKTEEFLRRLGIICQQDIEREFPL